jgi:predicted alpha/beta-hydrolase family hydrolase
MSVVVIETPRGPARAHLSFPGGAEPAAAAVILSHGAGGGVGAPDLQAAQRAALAGGWAVALVEQPYRVAGRRAPAPALHLDEAWTAVVARLGADELVGLPVVTGGRSMGARVACRTAAATSSIGVLCLAFPLKPPQRASATKPSPSRLGELDAAAVPTLVVQGVNDRFGMPPEGPGRTVVQVAGDHGLKADLPAVQNAVADWLAGRQVRPGKA